MTKGSDVYSFGVICWCLYMQAQPYVPWKDANRFVGNPQLGTFPEGATPSSYSHLTRACLQADPHDRPTFSSLLGRLQDLVAGGGSLSLLEMAQLARQLLLLLPPLVLLLLVVLWVRAMRMTVSG